MEIYLHLYSKTVVSNTYKQNKMLFFFKKIDSFKASAYWISVLFTFGAGNCYGTYVLGILE